MRKKNVEFRVATKMRATEDQRLWSWVNDREAPRYFDYDVMAELADFIITISTQLDVRI